jgi:hypothetical protein
MGFQILNLVFLFSDAEEDQTTTIIIQSIMVASVIPIVGLALWGVCSNSKNFFMKKNLKFIIFFLY